MTPEEKQDRDKLFRVTAYALAAVAGIFVLCITTLLAATWVQLTVHDPLDSPALVALQEAYAKGDTDPTLINGIRTLDLQARRAYFTNQAQMRFGSYLAFGGVFVLLLALKCAASLSRPVPAPSKCPGGDRSYHNATLARRAIGAGGFVCLVTVVAVAYLTDHMHFSMARTPDTAPASAAQPDGGGDVLPAPLPDGTPAHQPTAGTVVGDQPDAPADDLPELGAPPLPPPQPLPSAPKYWPGFRGPNGLGIADVETPPTNWDGESGSNILWKVKVPRLGFSSPVVWSNRVFVTGADNAVREVYCFSTDTGDILWRAEVETVIEGELPEISEDTGFAAPTMTTDGERVYAIFGTGDIAAFTMDGTRAWSRSLGVPENHYGHSSSLFMYDSRVLVQYDHGKSASIIAVEGASGKLAWETERPVKIAWTSPILATRDGHDEVILSAEPFVISYDPGTGKELWRVRCMSGEVGPSPAFANGYVFVANEYAKLVALDPGKQQILWENEDDLPDTSSPLAVDHFLFTAGSAGMVTCYEAESGKIHWKEEFDEGFYASPIFAAGMVYLADRTGIMHIFKVATTYKSVAEPKLGEDSVCTAAFVGNRIFLRGMNHLYCVAQPAEKKPDEQ